MIQKGDLKNLGKEKKLRKGKGNIWALGDFKDFKRAEVKSGNRERKNTKERNKGESYPPKKLMGGKIGIIVEFA